ncbi:hypothetical protein TIFTF001_021089, partial [Ficus carica]
SWPHF